MFKTVTTALITAALFVGCSDSGSGSGSGSITDDLPDTGKTPEEVAQQVEEQDTAEIEETLTEYEEALEVAKAELAALQSKIEDAAGNALVGLISQDEEGTPSLDLDALKEEATALTGEIAEIQEKMSAYASELASRGVNAVEQG